MNSAQKIHFLTQQVCRQVARSASSDAYPVPARYSKFLAQRAKLEIPDHTPIHLKGGLGDKILCQLTWGLALLGTGMALHVFYQIVAGKKS